MRTPVEAILLILSYEQLRLVPYKDAVGIWTWGWGHAKKQGEPVPPRALTREQANALFLADLAGAEAAVDSALRDAPGGLGERVADVTRRYGALVSFAFNTGRVGETMLAKIKAGDYDGAGEEFGRWVYGTIGGKKVRLEGLVVRRADEERLWRGPT